MSRSTPNFRPATLADLEHVVEQAIDLQRKVGTIYGFDLDVESIIATCHRLIHHHVVLVGNHCAAAGQIVTFPWNYKVKVGNVMFWNFTKPKGILIFPAICEALIERGATHIGCASHFPDNRAEATYRRFRLDPAETQYLQSASSMKSAILTTIKGAKP